MAITLKSKEIHFELKWLRVAFLCVCCIQNSPHCVINWSEYDAIQICLCTFSQPHDVTTTTMIRRMSSALNASETMPIKWIKLPPFPLCNRCECFCQPCLHYLAWPMKGVRWALLTGGINVIVLFVCGFCRENGGQGPVIWHCD